MNTRRTTSPTTSRRLGAFTSNEDANISRRRGMLYGTPVGGALVGAFLQGRTPRRRRASPAKCKSNNQPINIYGQSMADAPAERQRLIFGGKPLSDELASLETTNREVEAAEAEFIGSPVVKFK
jgi:hypothetical protein